MRKPVVRLLCAAGILVMMACGAYALGTGDSLITLSYLRDVFMPQAVEAGEEAAEELLQETYDQASSSLDEIQRDAIAQLTGEEGEALYSAALQAQEWHDGDFVELFTGSGALMLNGTATVTHNGAFIDVTEGVEVASGDQLKSNHRYLVGEDTQAWIGILSGAASIGVQGSYEFTDGGIKATPFYDVSQLDWYYGPVSYVYENELFSGMNDHHFGPSAAMNRAMLMTVLYKMAGAPEDEMAAADIQFDDVAESAWYAPYVKWGASQGITAGTGPTTFSPEMQVTRQQVVVLLYSFARNYLGLELTEGADLSGYQDLSQASDWAQEALSWAVAEGVLSSSSADSLTLSPLKSANRAEVATMLRAFAEKIL